MGRGALGTVFQDGEFIIRQGDQGNCMYVVQRGKVEVIQHSDNGEQHLAYLEPGDFFGEMAVFEKEARSASVKAIGESLVLKVDKKTLLRRITEDPVLAFSLLQMMSHRIRDLDELVSHYRSGSE